MSQRLHLSLADSTSTSTNILEYLDKTTAFITAALEENETNKVLVGNSCDYSFINYLGSLLGRS